VARSRAIVARFQRIFKAYKRRPSEQNKGYEFEREKDGKKQSRDEKTSFSTSKTRLKIAIHHYFMYNSQNSFVMSVIIMSS
jgi:hypothetical protein